MSMVGGLPSSGNTYQVVVSIDNTQTAASINQMVSSFKGMDQNFSAAVSQMRQTMGQLGAQARGQLSEIPESFAGMGRGAQGAMSSIGGLAAAFGVFSTGRQLVEGMKDSLTDLRSYTEKMNLDLVNMQMRLAEVQSITGNVGKDSSKVLQEHLEMMKYTGMTSEQAVKFTGEFVGEAEIYRPRYEPAQFAEIQRQAARFAMVQGGDAASHAILAGRLMGLMPEGQRTAEAVETRQADLYRRLNLAPGRTEALNSSFVQSLATLVSPTGKGGMVGSAEELANLSIPGARVAGEPSALDTTLDRFARVTTGNIRSKDWTKFLREELKIPQGTPAEQAMIPIFNRMASEQAKGTDIPTWLRERGINNSKEAATLFGMYNQRQDYFDAVAKVKEAPMTPAAAQKMLTDPYTLGKEGFRPELAYQRAVAGTRAAQIEQAQQNQLAEIFRARAVTELTRENRIGPQWQAQLDIGQRFDQMITNQIFGQDFKSRQAIDERAAMIYERENFRKLPGHAKFDKEGPSWHSRMFGISDRFVNEEYVLGNQLSADINQAESGRKLGFDAATGKATPDTRLLKDIADGVRKDRPMTVAKPAPSPKP